MQRRRATGVGPKCENTFTYVTFSFTFTTMNYQLLIPRPRRPCLACWHPLLATCSRTGTLVFAASRPQVCSVHTARNANEQHEILQRLISMAPAPPRPQFTVSPTIRPLLAACHHGAALQVEVRAFRRDPRGPPTSSDEIGPRGELAAGKSMRREHAKLVLNEGRPKAMAPRFVNHVLGELGPRAHTYCGGAAAAPSPMFRQSLRGSCGDGRQQVANGVRLVTR